jgi:RsiW-degrading membrane proteinase PrsW (M82 family)
MSSQQPAGFTARGTSGPVAGNPHPVVGAPGAVVAVPLRRTGTAVVITVLGFLLVSVLLLVVALYLLVVLGPGALFWSILLALVPLIGVLWGIRWIDKWEPEPRGALLFAFLWGAAASIVIALIFSGISQAFFASAGLADSPTALFFETVIQAPIVEEVAKGLGVLLLFWAVRKTFDGPIDGLVYGATVAIGFAFTENLQYFGLAIIDGGAGEVGATFLLRAIMSPFAHVMFTACTGVALGYAARRTGAFGAIGYLLLGLVPAIGLHAFWNSASFWAADWFRYYFLVQVPMFVLAIILVMRMRRHEQGLTRERLAEYGAAGWFTPSEVNQLSTAPGRRQAVAWAARYGLKRQYQAFVQHATQLAFTRQRQITGRDAIGVQRDQAALLLAIEHDRRALVALPPLLSA